ncbi:MAG: hypothetical protein LDLANPLL_01767 [Turneriella sp.]|nr:hypothetical protein [Turneriella sp.]
MKSWILKSEPDAFSIDQLMAERTQTTLWDGVRNYMARNNLLAMELGDKGYFYHSSCKVPAIVGEMRVVEKAFPDETQFNPESRYFDSKSTRKNPRWFSPRLQFERKYATPITRGMLHKTVLVNSQLFKSFRLSVLPLTQSEAATLEKIVLRLNPL